MKLSNRLTRNNPAKPSRSSKRPTDLPRDDMYLPSVHQFLVLGRAYVAAFTRILESVV